MCGNTDTSKKTQGFGGIWTLDDITSQRFQVNFIRISFFFFCKFQSFMHGSFSGVVSFEVNNLWADSQLNLL